ncbi:pro-sigmaK processing inhibitor BofA family protein [Caldicellulosiruptor morganii]|uniref:Pro-sigmaK processing inhibitor BofA family protein n=1 Tax=Caldicellulosiruptor morganii TaxID=1387555 RepID=A0ABY7BNI8_9FIRM|nr:pro-sigmaK processing inhibitor BofA family protein [Caldicellulosiruptor morganii]WAM33096.1 pro-sigmaK processing inhibitor BofA family protein [Caldicellulosiruptor morganii]
MKLTVSLLVRFLFTCLFILFFNLLFDQYNLHIGFNVVNLAIGTLIGFPGFALLFVLAFLFWK